MIYEALAEGWRFGESGDPFMRDTALNIGEGNITQGQLENALNGKSFFVFGANQQKQHLPRCDAGLFWYYYEIFENCENFGLPHGKGWLDEPPWLLEFLHRMRKVKRKIYGQNQVDAANQSGESHSRY